VNLFASVFWNGVLPMSAAGSQMRVGPEGFRTSARVIISNVRQVGVSARGAKRFPVFGNMALAETMLAERRKSRRFIGAPFKSEHWVPSARKIKRYTRLFENAILAVQELESLAITTVVQELFILGKSRVAAMRISSCGRSPRTIGQ
jgi:hypothetical protein